MAEVEFFTIGQIVAPHGVRGDVRIYPDTDFPDRFLTMAFGYIGGVRYDVEHARFHKRVVLMKFKGVDTRNDAEALVGKELQVRREDLVPLKEGEHYVFEVIGLTAVDTQGQLLGKVTDVIKTGSNDVYAVTDGEGRETLYAAIPDVIKSINVEEGAMVIDPPEWVEG